MNPELVVLLTKFASQMEKTGNLKDLDTQDKWVSEFQETLHKPSNLSSRDRGVLQNHRIV